MSLLAQTFTALNGKKALIPFVTAGHPDPDLTVFTMHQLVACGADVIELGIPFSDPMADGVVIQQSSEQAIAKGVNLQKVLQMVAEFRQSNHHTPVVLMGYLNPIESYGYQNFVEQAAQAGVDAVLLVDSPPEESERLLSLLKTHNMQQIFLISPTTTRQRAERIIEKAAGFIYYVALKGVTGAADLDRAAVAKDLRAIKTLSDLPLAVGFGIKDAASALAVAANAEAVVIGSALVSLLNHCQTEQAITQTVKDFLSPIRQALDSL